jgi:hypothetical protein
MRLNTFLQNVSPEAVIACLAARGVSVVEELR